MKKLNTIGLSLASSMLKGAAKQQLFNGKPIKRVHVMVKPFGPVCNLDCEYCYYLSKEDLLETASDWKISEENLERFIIQYFEANNFQEVVFTWQGGEPTLLGISFFEKVVMLQKKHCPPGVICHNDLQTNGTLITGAWCAFLKKNNFLVGLSIDGPQEMHDHFRKNKDAQGTFSKVLRTARLLHKYRVDFATLTCVNSVTGKHPLAVYRFLRDVIKSPRIQFIPIVEPKSFKNTAPHEWPREEKVMIGDDRLNPAHPDAVVFPWCVSADEWGTFLSTIFDEWYKKDFGRVMVHFFEAMVEAWIGRIPSPCTLGPMCGKGLAMEHNGDLYACDHFVYPAYKLGNINDKTLDEMAYSPNQEAFGMNKEASLPQKCRKCEFQFSCYGECPKNRFILTETEEEGLNYLCQGWFSFFQHIDPYMKEICAKLGFLPVKKLTLHQ